MAICTKIFSKSGSVKIKAVCRVRTKAKTQTLTRAFQNLSKTRAWAESTERQMRAGQLWPVMNRFQNRKTCPVPVNKYQLRKPVKTGSGSSVMHEQKIKNFCSYGQSAVANDCRL